MPIVHISSRVCNNWHPFAFTGGSPPLYSTFVTSSDEAFALFLIKYYRSPPSVKEKFAKISKTVLKIEKNENENDNENNDEAANDDADGDTKAAQEEENDEKHIQ